RPHGAVQAIEVSAAACAFLDACAAGRPMMDAALAALEIDSAVDLSLLMATLLDAGAFASAAKEESR
ncbi:MAG: DNA-binding domain-containing protein, partial [Burkholderiaceae bacterium]